MIEVRTTPNEGRIALSLDEATAPRDAVLAAAFAFTDRCWVRLDRGAGSTLTVILRVKAGGDAAALDALAEQVKEELLQQAWRQQALDAGRDLVASIALAAYGASAPPDAAADAGSLDDLLAEGGAFDDPLGIATSWEEKYAKKGEGAS